MFRGFGEGVAVSRNPGALCFSFIGSSLAATLVIVHHHDAGGHGILP